MTPVAINRADWRLRGAFTPPLAPGSLEAGDPLWARKVLPAGQLGAHLKFAAKLQLEDYVDDSVQPPPAVSRPHPGFNWGMLANDRYGDCVIAMMLHAIEGWHLDAGTPPPAFTDDDAIRMYSAITGFNPNDPNSDQGTDENEAMKYWQAPGLAVQGSHKIVAAVAVDPGNLVSCRRSIYEFGALMTGVAMPATAQGQTEWVVQGDPNHDPDSRPGSWGGHGIPYVEYDPDCFKLITWGTELLASVEFHNAYCQQAFVVVSEEMLSNTGVGPSGVAWDALVADINNLSQPPAKDTQPSRPKPTASNPKADASPKNDS